jgi:hypothetical protein
MKDLIEQAAEMLSMGYSDNEVIRILRVPVKDANALIEAAERWNDDTWVPMTDEIIDEMAAYYGEE